MRVLFLKSGSLISDSRGQKELKSLHNDGFRVSAYTWERHGQSLKVPAFIDENFVYIKEAEDGAGLKNLKGLTMFISAVFFFLVRNGNKYNVIHCVNFDMALPCFLAKTLFFKKYKIVYDIYDFYVDTYPVPTFLRKFVRNVDIRVLNKVDLVILAIDSRIHQIYPAHPKKYIVVYNTPDDLEFEIKDTQKAVHDYLNIVFVGALQDDRFLSELEQAATDLPFVRLTVGGFGQTKYEKLMHDSASSNYLGRLEYSDALKVESEADILVAMYNPKIPNHKFSAPNKVFEAMMLGKPIIVAEGMGLNSLVKNSKCGFVIDYDFESFCSLLTSILQNPTQLKEMGKNARYMYENKYSWKANSDTLIQGYHDLG